jgi:cell fate (sporulation/competence/biofilm development) regulator YmcA (YheA/YmcA/DUF963 family)
LSKTTTTKKLSIEVSPNAAFRCGEVAKSLKEGKKKSVTKKHFQKSEALKKRGGGRGRKKKKEKIS